MKILGLHYDHPFIRWAALELKGKKCELQSLKSFAPHQYEDVKRLYKSQKKDLVATGMVTLVRHLEFKISSTKKIKKGLIFQIESLTSLPSEQVVYCTQMNPKGKGADVTIFLASKEILVEQIQFWEKLSILPDLLSSSAQALVNFAQLRCPSLPNGFVVHLGSKETICVWFDAGIVKKSFVIDEGIETLLSLLWEDRKKVLFENEVLSFAKQMDLLLLKSHLNPALSTRLEYLSNQLIGVLSSFQKNAKPLADCSPNTLPNPLKVLFTGRTDAFINICPFLLKNAVDIEQFYPPLPLNQDELKGAIAIGLAIETAGKSQRQVQFLKDEFTPDRQWRKAGCYGLLFLTLSLVASIGLGLFGLEKVEEKKAILAKNLTQIVAEVDQPLASNLLSHGLEHGVALAMSAVQKHDREALFLVQAPTVTEVLGWLSTHPLLVSLAKNGDPLDLKELHYRVVSLPKIGHARDPYQAKVDLQFRLKDSMSARKFHEELLRGDGLVDASQEITWDSLNEGYQVTFYLKNRAPYVH